LNKKKQNKKKQQQPKNNRLLPGFSSLAIEKNDLIDFKLLFQQNAKFFDNLSLKIIFGEQLTLSLYNSLQLNRVNLNFTFLMCEFIPEMR